MGSVTAKRFCDCFVNFDGCRLMLGNSRFVREFDLSKNLLHTVCMRKSDGTVVVSESSSPSDFYFYGDGTSDGDFLCQDGFYKLECVGGPSSKQISVTCQKYKSSKDMYKELGSFPFIMKGQDTNVTFFYHVIN